MSELDDLERRMRRRFLAEDGLGPDQPESVRRRRAAEVRLQRNPFANSAVNALTGLVGTRAGREQIGRGAEAARQLAPLVPQMARALPEAVRRAAPRVAGDAAAAAPEMAQAMASDPMGLLRELTGAGTMERGREALIQAQMAQSDAEREAAGRGLAREAGGQAVVAAPLLRPAAVGRGMTAAPGAIASAVQGAGQTIARRPVTSAALAGATVGSDTPGAIEAASQRIAERRPAQDRASSVNLGREAIEDLYVRAGDQAPIRPDAARASRAGLMQGLSLDNLDDMRRGQAVSREDVDALRRAYEDDPDNPQIAAALMQAQYDFDPVAFEAATNPEAFRSARTAGEVAIGAGTAVGSTLAGLALRRRMGVMGPIVAAGGAGAAKGAAYGYGSGVGEVDETARQLNTVRDAVTTGTISLGLVPAVNALAAGVNRAPIYTQRAANAARGGASRMMGGPGYQGPRAIDTRTRLFTPAETVLRPGVDAGDVVARARAADAARPQPTTRVGRALNAMRPPPLVPRLEALAASQASGVAARQAASMEPLARRISKPSGRSVNFTAGLSPTTKAGRPSQAYQNAQAAELASRQALSPGFDDLAFRQLSAPNQKKVRRVVNQRITQGQLTPEELAFLQTSEGQQRLQTLRMLDEPFDFDYTPPPAGARINPGLPVVGRDRITARTTPETAAALGSALGTPANAAGRQTAAGPLRLQDVFTTQPRQGFAPYRPNDPIRDLVQKPLAVGFAIPATEAINARLPVEFGVVKGDPGRPLGGDPDERARLTRGVLQAEAADAARREQEAVSGTNAIVDQEIADERAQLRALANERARAAREPRQYQREQPDGSVRVVDNARAYEAAQVRLREIDAETQARQTRIRAIEAGRRERIEEMSRAARRDLETARNRQAIMGSAQ